MRRSFFFVGSMLIAMWLSNEACKHQPQDIVLVTPVDTTVVVKPPVDKLDSTGWKCSADTAYYADVQAILTANCAMSGCHDVTSHASGIIYTDFTNTKTYGKVSKIIGEVSGNKPNMPPAPRPALTASQIALIQKWINQGALNKTCNPSFGSCDTTTVKFADYVSPLITNSCKGCHNPNGSNGGINLTTYAEIKAVATLPKFMGSIKHLSGFSAMPKGGAMLSDCQIKKLQRWINLGALNN